MRLTRSRSLANPLRVAAAVISLLALVSIPSRAADVATTTDANSTGFTDSRKIVRNPATGRLFVAYRALTSISGVSNYHEFVSYSDDNGLTWNRCNAGNPIDNIGNSKHRNPSLAIDSKNALHLVWYGNDSSAPTSDEMEIKYSRSSDDCATWTSTKFLTSYSGYPGKGYWQEHPVIVSYGNFVFIVWQGRDSNDLSHAQVRLLRSPDRGKTWDPIRLITTGSPAGGNFSRPALIVSGSSSAPTLVVISPVFIDKSTGLASLYWTKSTDGGQSFPGGWARVCASCSGDQRHASITRDSSGKAHVVWREGPKDGVPQVYYSRLSGSVWTSPTLVSASPQYQFSPQIEVDQAYSDTVRVIWSETNDPSGYPSEAPASGYVRMASKSVSASSFNPSLQLSTNGLEVYPIFRRTSAIADGPLDVLWTYVRPTPPNGKNSYPIQHSQLDRSR